MPVVGFRVDDLSDHVIRLELLDRLELRVPAEHERRDTLHLGVAHGAVDALHAFVVERDGLLDDDVAARLGGSLELLRPDVRRCAGRDDFDGVVVEELVLG